jgi:cell pole-organizing protein PopZ
MDSGNAKLSFGAQRLFEFPGAFCNLSYQQYRRRPPMKKLVLAAILVASQSLALSAFAQDKSRAEVKADTASAAKAGAIAKGEANAPQAAAKSTKARADVKADAAAATKTGATAKGEATPDKATAKNTMSAEEKAAARAKRKAEAAAATKAGTPKGEQSK